MQQTDSFDVRWKELTGRSRVLALMASGSWLVRSESDGQPTLVNWCDGRERGILSRPFQLGRLRAAAPHDVRTLPFDPSDYSLSPLDEGYRYYVPTLETPKDGRTLLILKHASSPTTETRFLIDTTRHVVLQFEHRINGKTTSATKFDDFVEVGGSWWARRIETTDDRGRVISRITRTVQSLSAEALAKQVKGELAGKDMVQFLRLPAKTVVEAKRAVAAGKATFDDHFTLLRYFAGRQQWTRSDGATAEVRGADRRQAGRALAAYRRAASQPTPRGTASALA